MNSRTFHLGLWFCLAACFTLPRPLFAERPNFVVINIDDLGYADIGPFGSQLNRTPHLDQMAKEGRRLKSHYAAPVVSPGREVSR
jgi:arylsulfatase A-like enzyme